MVTEKQALGIIDLEQKAANPNLIRFATVLQTKIILLPSFPVHGLSSAGQKGTNQ